MDARLSSRFVGVAGKRLALVECAAEGVSNQHELDAGQHVVRLLGRERLQDVPCRYIYLDGDGEAVLDEQSTITYYDSRINQPHRSAEFRLTYPVGARTMAELARAGDLCWLAPLASTEPSITVIVAPSGAPAAIRLDQLFGTQLQPDELFEVRREGKVFARGTVDEQPEFLDGDDVELLELLGVEVEPSTLEHVDAAIDHFGGQEHPPAAEFTAFARARCQTADPRDDPDQVLFDWFTFTYDLYLAYEEQMLQPVLDAHFANQEHIDVPRFFKMAKSLTNSRFSRAGGSFESQVAALFDAVGVRYTPQSTNLPDGSKPDFLMPSRAHYDSDDPDVLALVTFVGAKTTTRERWQQLVAEAQRLGTRHMLTMDKGLTGRKVETMGKKCVVPVLPRPIIDTQYGSKDWCRELMPVGEFIDLARDRQEKMPSL